MGIKLEGIIRGGDFEIIRVINNKSPLVNGSSHLAQTPEGLSSLYLPLLLFRIISNNTLNPRYIMIP